MQPKTDRFEMRLDPDTLKKVDTWRAHQADLPSRAEAFRRLVETGLSEMESKPLRLSDGEKLITSMLCELYKHLEIDGEIDPLFIEKALHGGHYWGLDWQYSGIFDMPADSTETVHEVVQTLNVWRFLERSYANLSEKDKERVKKEAKPFGENVVFPGFDGNDETEHFSIAQFLINELGRFVEFKGRDLNSHMPSIDEYRRMIRAFEPMKPRLRGGNLLSVGHIIKLLNAQWRDGV